MPKILATDLDGTLLYPNMPQRLITKKNKKFLRSFIEEGNRVVLVSSRNDYLKEKIEKEIGYPCDLIGANGALIKKGNTFLKECYFDNKLIKEVVENIFEYFSYLGMFLTSEKYSLIMKKSSFSKMARFFYRFWHSLQGKRKEPFDISDELFDKEINEGKVYKILLFVGVSKKKKTLAKELNKKIWEKFGDSIEASWIGEIIEISPKGCSKASGLEYYIKSEQLERDSIYVVGDSGNDISMFKSFPEKSFCMLHAPLSVQKYAKYKVVGVYEINKFLKKGV